MSISTFSEKVAWVKSNLGTSKVSRDGNNVAVQCPACKKDGKFSINLNTWMCHCWVCGVKSKNLITILKKYKGRNISDSFSSTFNIKIKNDKNPGEFEKEERVLNIPDSLVMLAGYSGKNPDILSLIRYCKLRGLSEKDFWLFKICGSEDYHYRRRVIFPSFSAEGEMNYFVSRTIDPKGFPKYKNANIKKTEIVFNEINVRWDREVTIVEGAFDLVKAGDNAICLLGSKLGRNSKLFSDIVKNKASVLLALDSDMKKEMQNIARDLSEFGIEVRIAHIPDGKDVGDLTKRSFKKIKEKSTLWSPEMHMRFKIKSIKSGSIF